MKPGCALHQHPEQGISVRDVSKPGQAFIDTIQPFQALYGRRFSAVMIPRCMERELRAKHTRAGQWYRYAMACRFEPDAVIVLTPCLRG